MKNYSVTDVQYVNGKLLDKVRNLMKYSYSKVVSIMNISNNMELSLYPNPTFGPLFIENNFEEDNYINVELYSSLDFLIYKKTFNQGNIRSIIEFNMIDLPLGMYIVKVIDDQKNIYLGKFFKL
ncbi:MAG: T9SS type A sorting domain-containing protein [Saprospiraceae bacterium]